MRPPDAVAADALAFLHTGQVHVATFERLVRTTVPDRPLRHLVREDLLADARTLGVDDAGLVQRVHDAMHEAASGGAPLVVCTCSSIGGIAEQMKAPFATLRIDRAMADQAVRVGPRVLIAAASHSTLAPTEALIRSAAANAGVEVRPTQLLIAEAWPHFEAGDMTRYVQTLADLIRKTAATADVVVLAQASMAPVAEVLHDLGIPVLSSPEPGVAHALAVAASQKA